MDGLRPYCRGQTVSESKHPHKPIFLIDLNRLKIKAKIRHLRKNPGNIDPQTIQLERDELTTLFLQLKQLQQAADVAEPNRPSMTSPDPIDAWDDLAFDTVTNSPEIFSRNSNDAPGTSQSFLDSTNGTGPVLIENQIIALPSNGNTNMDYRNLEISHRVSKAEELLNHIRNLIAEKSFQFSHVIRVSPRKGVTTRARAVVRKLNNEIAEHCRFYNRCRSSLLTLHAESSILSQFKVLHPGDVNASTAVLNPNEPGSTRIQLSWIWQTSAQNILGYTGPLSDIGSVRPDLAGSQNDMADDPQSLLECMSYFGEFFFYPYIIISVRRIHWLRARAQRMRWAEEVTLTSYEMQWTVRYFTQKSKFWSDFQKTLADQGSTMDINLTVARDYPGQLAYAKRKHSTWFQLAVKSDRAFKILNNAYKSPL